MADNADDIESGDVSDHTASEEEAVELIQEKRDLEPSLYGIKPALKDKFNIPAIRELIISILHSTLDGQIYLPHTAKTITIDLANAINNSIKGLQQSRYKHIVQVVLGEQKGAGVKTAMRSLWDIECDTYVSEEYKNPSLFCLVAVFGIYFY
ncbi:tctex1 domain-containing protein 2-like [Ctenocephalides felis]|uniref:tctex1 domain-containing protein 2-like n=1 Tax=Ctenocephalides felis TaxID=7515 RepID=UPI000E6E1307|nr:tctex1 domain-containing protein 2-like [Ctenocephalides felis]